MSESNDATPGAATDSVTAPVTEANAPTVTDQAADALVDAVVDDEPVPVNPKAVFVARLKVAADKASNAKKRLMMDELADAVCDAISAIISTVEAG